MSQTILALLGMVVITLFAFNVTSYHVQQQRHAIAREVEDMAGTIALETLEIARGRAFDNAVTSGFTVGDTTDLATFTYTGAADHFPTGKACQVLGTGTDLCTDIDDFHKMQTALRPFVMGTDTVYFRVDATVQYVHDDDATKPRVNARTFSKEVTVTVQDTMLTASGRPLMPGPVTISRVFTYF